MDQKLKDDFIKLLRLNSPPRSSSKRRTDTFFVRKSDDPDISDLVLITTVTSPVQKINGEQQKPPIRSIMPGRVYRNEAVSPKIITFIFHQVEAYI